MRSKNKDCSSSPQSLDYLAAAILLAESYGNLLKEKEYIDKVLAGEIVYTEEDALEELISTTASTESDTGIRVQTSNISNTTERIGLLLASGFVEKRNRDILQEVLKNVDHRLYLNWMLDVINTAKTERMSKFERGLMDRLFVKHKSYRQIREAYKGKKLYDCDISKARKSILSAIADEIELRDDGSEEESGYIDHLRQELKAKEASDG